MDSGDESDNDHIFTEMLEGICDGNQSHRKINRRGSRYKIRDGIKQRQTERKGALNDLMSCDYKPLVVWLMCLSMYRVNTTFLRRDRSRGNIILKITFILF